jgi:hypothetical protein
MDEQSFDALAKPADDEAAKQVARSLQPVGRTIRRGAVSGFFWGSLLWLLTAVLMVAGIAVRHAKHAGGLKPAWV